MAKINSRLTDLFYFAQNRLSSKLCYILLGIMILFLYLRSTNIENLNKKEYYDDSNSPRVIDEGLVVKNLINKQRQMVEKARQFDEYEKIIHIPEQVNRIITRTTILEKEIPSEISIPEDPKKLLRYIYNLPNLKPKLCGKNLELYLNKLKSTQQETLNYWYQMDVPSKIKWSALASIYEPRLIKFSSMFRFTSDGELKYFLRFNSENEPNCNVYTLGLGFDYKGEAKLFRKYPQCKLTGVDPEERINKDLVEKVPNARFIKATIGAKDGTYTASVRQMNKKYRSVTVEHIGIANFFQKYNGNKTIDMIIIDVEGAEFELLPVLVEEKDKLPTICQINVEVHYPPENYGFTHEQALENVYKFFNDGTYTVFNFELFLQMMRIFVINTSNEECIRKFFCDTY